MRPTLRVPASLGRTRRRSSIRTMLIVLAVVPSLALVGLWGYTANRLWSEASDLRDQNSISAKAGPSAYAVMLQLQEERRLSAQWLADAGDTGKAGLDAVRSRTDAALGEFTQWLGRLSDTDSGIVDKARLIEAARDALPGSRARIDRRDGDRAELLRPYDTAVQTQLATFSALSLVDSDGKLTHRSETLIGVFRAAELTSREDALMTYALGVGELGSAEYLDFAEAAGGRRVLYAEEIEPNLEPRYAASYRAMTSSPSWKALVAAETAVLAMGVDGRPSQGLGLPLESADWRLTMDQVMGEIATFNNARAATIIDAAEKRVDDQEFTVWMITAFGLAVVVAVSLLCWAVTRSLRRRLLGLHEATVELAQKRLPSVIARLSHGEAGGDASALADLADPAGEASDRPEMPYGNDEIGQVAAAFGTAERAAVDGAIRLAREREGYAKVFHNVALRTQSLVGRQLRVLDAMENRHQDPDLLEDLFVLDHLATRLRRYEENLVILSGHQPGRRWSRPVRMVDVVRSAVGEVEDYHRVDVRVGSDLALAGPAVGGVIHLLAELLENSTKFSPPDTPVEVRGMPVATGLAVEIEDRGLGMGAEEYEALNAELAHPTPFDMVALADDLRLGLFVVAQLARRYGISVTLRPSPYGGTLAIVLVPKDLIIGGDDGDGGDARDEADATGEPAHDTADTADTTDTAAAGRPALARPPGGPRDTDGAKPADRQTPPATVTRLTIPAPGPAEDTGEAEADATEEAEAEATGAVKTPAATAAPARTARSAATPAASPARPKPLPRRVRQTHLAAPLRETPHTADAGEPDTGADRPARLSPHEAAATISAFQRASERARAAADITAEPPEKES